MSATNGLKANRLPPRNVYWLMRVQAWVFALVFVAPACAERSPVERPSAVPAEPITAEAGTRIFFAWNNEITVVDVEAASSDTIELPELAGGDPPFHLIRRGDQLVFWGGETYALDARNPRTDPVVIAEDSWFFVPSADPDRVWIAVRDEAKSTPYHIFFSEVREVTAEGDVTRKGPAMDDAWMEGALDAGVVFEAEDDLVVWDPAAEKIIRAFGNPPMAASYRNLIVWCEDSCAELHLTDVLTGAERTIEPPAGYDSFDAWSGEFTPDGRLFAVAVGNPPRYEGPGGAAIVNVATSDIEMVPGSEEEAGIPSLTWDPTGTRLFIVVGQQGKSELRYFDLGADEAKIAPVTPPQDYLAMVSA